MPYYFNKTLALGFDEAIIHVTEALQKAGFGILSDIDVKAALKKKLDVDFRRYRILGACHPPSAYKALQLEDKIGTMLPCSVIVQEWNEGKVEVAAIDPFASMQAVGNEDLNCVALEVRAKLKDVVEDL